MGVVQGFHPFMQGRETYIAPWGVGSRGAGSVLYTDDITKNKYVIVK